MTFGGCTVSKALTGGGLECRALVNPRDGADPTPSLQLDVRGMSPLLQEQLSHMMTAPAVAVCPQRPPTLLSPFLSGPPSSLQGRLEVVGGILVACW